MSSEGRSQLLEKRLSKFVAENPVLRVRSEFTTSKFRAQLVDCLLDGSVYSVVESLNHLQDLKETQLLSQRYTRLRELGNQPTEEQTRTIDKQIMEQIDQMVAEQQSNLSCAGVPTFRVTNESKEVETQLEIIKFIVSLHDIYE